MKVGAVMNLALKSSLLRRDILDMVYRAKAGHIGGDLSVIDILNVLYSIHVDVTPDNFCTSDHDRLLLSKGHCVEALYAILAHQGFFPRADLETLYKFGSKYIGHPTRSVNGVEMCSGSLGHGLSVGAGMALAAKFDKASWRVWVVIGDGELAEGSIWEGAMFAGHYKIDNLTAIIDRNRLQISGNTEDVMAQDNQISRWCSFGWYCIEVDGHDTTALDDAFMEATQIKGKPTVIIANTVKGKGISFMENNASWHHRIPTETEYIAAVAELEQMEREAAG